MNYGYFDDNNREYVITNPRRPSKWINYIGTLQFGGFVDHTGGALICKQDPTFNMLEKALFIKRFPVSDFRMLPEMGSNVESDVHDAYLELETLGKLSWLNPGESVRFEETWEVIPSAHRVDLEEARNIIKQLSQS